MKHTREVNIFKHILWRQGVKIMENLDKNVKEEGNEVETPKSPNFVERLVTNVVINHTPDDLFIIEFLRPELSLYAEKDSGKILGHKGMLVSDVRIYMTPKAAKRFLNALKENISKYEEKFGSIILEEDTKKNKDKAKD